MGEVRRRKWSHWCTKKRRKGEVTSCSRDVFLTKAMNLLRVTAAAHCNHLWHSRNPRNHPKTNQQCSIPSRFTWQLTSRQKHSIQVRMEKVRQNHPERVSRSIRYRLRVRRCGMLNSKRPSKRDSVSEDGTKKAPVTKLFSFSKWWNYCVATTRQCQSALDHTSCISATLGARRIDGTGFNFNCRRGD